jgi:hypothetical protein
MSAIPENCFCFSLSVFHIYLSILEYGGKFRFPVVCMYCHVCNQTLVSILMSKSLSLSGTCLSLLVPFWQGNYFKFDRKHFPCGWETDAEIWKLTCNYLFLCRFIHVGYSLSVDRQENYFCFSLSVFHIYLSILEHRGKFRFPVVCMYCHVCNQEYFSAMTCSLTISP